MSLEASSRQCTGQMIRLKGFHNEHFLTGHGGIWGCCSEYPPGLPRRKCTYWFLKLKVKINAGFLEENLRYSFLESYKVDGPFVGSQCIVHDCSRLFHYRSLSLSMCLLSAHTNLRDITILKDVCTNHNIFTCWPSGLTLCSGTQYLQVGIGGNTSPKHFGTAQTCTSEICDQDHCYSSPDLYCHVDLATQLQMSLSAGLHSNTPS